MASVELNGFEELVASCENFEKSIDNKGEALLAKIGSQAVSRAQSLSPIIKQPRRNRKAKPGQLKESWEAQSPKKYRNGSVNVVRLWSRAPHSHLIDRGHNIVTTGGRTFGNTKTGKLARKSKDFKTANKAETHGRTQAENIVQRTVDVVEPAFGSGAEKILNEAVGEF